MEKMGTKMREIWSDGGRWGGSEGKMGGNGKWREDRGKWKMRGAMEDSKSNIFFHFSVGDNKDGSL